MCERRIGKGIVIDVLVKIECKWLCMVKEEEKLWVYRIYLV